MAYSSSSSDSDYTLGRFGASIETDMSIVLPYMQFEMDGGASGHIMLGVVSGEATLNQTDADGHRRPVDVPDVAGGSWRLVQFENSTLSWSGDLNFSTLTTSEADLEVAARSHAASSAACSSGAGSSWSHNGLGESGTARPRIGLQLRQDSGDGITGTGIELTAGMQMLSGSERLSLDFNVRALAAHSAEDLQRLGRRAWSCA